ncbi:ESX secretion-associated protein EspG [Saccharopolyspora sp. NPDC047091]|uniref:ESX secretion-associated protein EspG n=1 Tax=Saccharopolyspora sp. NPDC047091 TaxID=3155924 RepID=UPI0033E37D4F
MIGGSALAGAGPVRLSALEFDVLAEHLGLDTLPLVLRVPSPGRTWSERAELADSAWRSMGAKQLGDRRRLDPALDRMLRLLAHPESEVDGRTWFDRSVRVLAASGVPDGSGADAVLVVKNEDALTLRPVSATGLVREATSVLPALGAGPGRSVTVRSADLDEAASATAGNAEALEGELVRRGVRGDDAEMLTSMVREAGARGQFGAAARDRLGRRVRAPRVVGFFDTPHGRYAQLRRDSPSGDSWSTVAPADGRRLIAHVDELLTELAR